MRLYRKPTRTFSQPLGLVPVLAQDTTLRETIPVKFRCRLTERSGSRSSNLWNSVTRGAGLPGRNSKAFPAFSGDRLWYLLFLPVSQSGNSIVGHT